MNGFESSIWFMLVLIIASFQLNFLFSCSLNDEGIALLKFRERVVKDPFGALSSWNEDDRENKPCSWFGIECVDEHVVSLDLRNFCLEGTLGPELGCLLHIKSIILRNNSFSGAIPEEIRDLKELKLLDLGYNKFTGPLPPEFGQNIRILLLDNNGPSANISPQVEHHLLLLEAPVNDNHITCAMQSLPHTRNNCWEKGAVHLRKLNEMVLDTSPAPNSGSSNPTSRSGEDTLSSIDIVPSPSTSPKAIFDKLQPPPPPFPPPLQPPPSPPPPPSFPSQQPVVPLPPSDALSPPPVSPNPTAPVVNPPNNKKPVAAALGGAVGGFIVLSLVIGAIYLWRSKKITKIRGFSGQLQKTFITGNDRSDGLQCTRPSFIEGVSNLKRSELETACEDFSNVISSSSIGTIYKGTLSSGIEIAVISLAVTSAKEWSHHLEMQFRKKIETLSKVNHKNFVKLMGYCEEENPFTRMIIFEYAPNGTLFEHLHVREAEHLDWGMRLRVTMGIAYCLEHMHQLVPPITHPNLNSSAVNLAEDYAAKVSDFSLWNHLADAQVQPTLTLSLSGSSATPDTNVYSFGLVLLEIMTGRVPFALGNNTLLEDWVSDYLRGERPLQEWVDPMLRYFNPGQLEKISEVIRKCLELDPKKRLTMRDVAARLGEITGIDRDKAAPRLYLPWWEEVEVLSVP